MPRKQFEQNVINENIHPLNTNVRSDILITAVINILGLES